MEDLLAFPIFSKTILSAAAFFAASYPIANESFYKSIIQEASQKIPSSKKQSTVSPVDAFTQQGFLLWDYLEGVGSDADCVPHFNNLISLCQQRNIQRVILFIPSPALPDGTTKYDFFQSQSAMADNFVTMTQKLVSTMRSKVPNFEVSLLFESGSFVSDVTVSPSLVSPYTSVSAPLPFSRFAGYFTNLTNMLNWSSYMITQPGIGITEIVFDPEWADPNGDPADKTDQQMVYNYSDNYKYAYGLTYTPYGTTNSTPIKLGTTVGIDESKVTYANLFTFPVNSVFTASFEDNIFPNPHPSWRLTNSELQDLTVPLLQSVYIQCYQTNMPAMFAAGATSSGGHDGTLAAQYFNSLLLDQPYIAGTGRISCMLGNPDVTGSSNSQFLTFQGGDPFLFTTDAPPKKIGIVDTVNSNTDLTLSYGPTITASKIPYQRTEIITAWDSQTPGISQEVIDNIYWMFALNYEEVPPHPPAPPYRFFGNWNLADFMTFITSLNQENKTNPPFPGFNFPTGNYVIYDYDLLTSTANTIPAIPWDVYVPTSQ